MNQSSVHFADRSIAAAAGMLQLTARAISAGNLAMAHKLVCGAESDMHDLGALQPDRVSARDLSDLAAIERRFVEALSADVPLSSLVGELQDLAQRFSASIRPLVKSIDSPAL